MSDARTGKHVRTPESEAPVIYESPEKVLLVRAAWMAYIGDMTQEQIARQLGLNRIRVNRMLAQARDLGIVQVRINSRIADCVALEAALCQRYGLRQAVVVPTPPDPALIPQTIGAAAGEVLGAHIGDGLTVGVGWGRTLELSLRSLAVRPVTNLSVVSLLGGLTRGSALNIYEISSRLAALYGAACYYFAAPAFTDTEESRDLLVSQSILQDAYGRARKADVAFLSVGSLDVNATIFKLGLVRDEERETLHRAGAVGEIASHWLDADGAVVDHSLNRRAIGVSPQDLHAIPTVIIPSGGLEKVPILRAVLRLGIPDVLVTDEAAAEAIMRDP